MGQTLSNEEFLPNMSLCNIIKCSDIT